MNSGIFGFPSRTSVTGEARILAGPVPPSVGTGVDGDFYLDYTGRTLYGPKNTSQIVGANRYWGIVVDSCVATQIPSVGELVFYDSGGNVIAPTTAHMIDDNASFPESRMINGDLLDFALSNRNNLSPREVIWCDFTSAVSVSTMRLYRRNDSFGYNEAPLVVRPFGSSVAPTSPWNLATISTRTLNWGGSHAAAVLFNDIAGFNAGDIWPVALS